MLASTRINLKYVLLLAIPLLVSAFTHLWNPIGFPYIVGDEGHYIRRPLYVLDQLGPQEGARYDHPYFGQLFFAAIFNIIGYPDSLNPEPGDVNSTQALYMVPRVIIGLLAVFDTFIIYKICERLYTKNKNIAFIGSILFAVMPLTWLTRRIYLDSIQLPLILLSILFAIYYYSAQNSKGDGNIDMPAKGLRRSIDKKTILIILSGVTLGLAIFTKIPALTLIPVVAYLILRSDRNYVKKIRALGLWFAPVILIPAIWPAYAISVGEYDNWYSGVFSQAERGGSGIGSIGVLFKIDPVLVSIGIIGLVFATVIRKDLFLLLWIIPFLVFHTIVPWTQHFHWIQLLPVFCISGALLIDGLAGAIAKKPRARAYDTLDGYTTREKASYSGNKPKALYVLRRFYDIIRSVTRLPATTMLVIMVTVIVIFGVISTSLLITTNVNSSFFEMVTFVSQHLPNYKSAAYYPYIGSAAEINRDDDADENGENKGLCLWCTAPSNRNIGGEDNKNEREETNEEEDRVTLIGNHWIFGTFWIPKFVYDEDHIFKGFFTRGSVDTEKVLIVADSRLLDAVSSENPEDHIAELQALYDDSTTVANFEEKRPEFNDKIYPYQSMSENRGIGKIEIKANY
jgi:hypothetical protein